MNKIDVCCGGVYLKGYVNIAKYPFELGDGSRSGCVADVLANVFELPYAKGSLCEILLVREIVLVRGMDHFTGCVGDRLLRKYAEVLAPDGALYLEMPSRNPVLVLTALERFVAVIAHSRGDSRFGRGPASSMLWGNKWAGFEYETHRYLWRFAEIVPAGRETGLASHSVFRYPASHIPFRAMGVALARSAAVKTYQPPSIRRRARRGLAGNLLGLARGAPHVVAGVFRAR
jgi:hypothetical protein